VAIFNARKSLVSSRDIAGLSTGRFFAPAVYAYRDLLVERLIARQAAAPGQDWPLPEIDMLQATMLLGATHRSFGIVLSWRNDGWKLRTYGKLADPAGPQACAIRWVVGELTPLDRRQLQRSLDFFTRVTAILVVAGAEDHLLIELCRVRSADERVDAFHRAWKLMLCEFAVDGLFRRAVESRILTLAA